jgi:hypothetical protein
MKHINTFYQHLNESQSLPDGVSEIDRKIYGDLEERIDRENLGESFTEEEKTKLDGVRQLLKFKRHQSGDYRFVFAKNVGVNAGGSHHYSPPAAWFQRMRPGTYILGLVFGNNRPTKYYTSKSLDHLILCVADLVDIEMEWIKIK